MAARPPQRRKPAWLAVFGRRYGRLLFSASFSGMNRSPSLMCGRPSRYTSLSRRCCGIRLTPIPATAGSLLSDTGAPAGRPPAVFGLVSSAVANCKSLVLPLCVSCVRRRKRPAWGDCGVAGGCWLFGTYNRWLLERRCGAAVCSCT